MLKLERYVESFYIVFMESNVQKNLALKFTQCRGL